MFAQLHFQLLMKILLWHIFWMIHDFDFKCGNINLNEHEKQSAKYQYLGIGPLIITDNLATIPYTINSKCGKHLYMVFVNSIFLWFSPVSADARQWISRKVTFITYLIGKSVSIIFWHVQRTATFAIIQLLKKV